MSLEKSAADIAFSVIIAYFFALLEFIIDSGNQYKMRPFLEDNT